MDNKMDNKPVKGRAHYIEDRIVDLENKIEKFEHDLEKLQKNPEIKK